jgi:transcriptional regulator with XRE-family HTH domain
MKTEKTYSRYSHDAAALLGRLIRQRRIELKMTTTELAQRANVSRSLLQRIERGDMGCAIGSVFEAAAIVGVPLFEASLADLKYRVAEVDKVLTLLPSSVRSAASEVKDDF